MDLLGPLDGAGVIGYLGKCKVARIGAGQFPWAWYCTRCMNGATATSWATAMACADTHARLAHRV